MTIAHRIPRERGGMNHPDNLRVECQRCNESAKDVAADPETYDELLPSVRGLKRDEKRSLLSWLEKVRTGTLKARRDI